VAAIIRLPDWPAIRAACARGAWQSAYGALPPCQGKGDAAWAAAADYIEAEKARALAAFVAEWRARKEQPT
jgi:hypothetical protein